METGEDRHIYKFVGVESAEPSAHVLLLLLLLLLLFHRPTGGPKGEGGDNTNTYKYTRSKLASVNVKLGGAG